MIRSYTVTELPPVDMNNISPLLTMNDFSLLLTLTVKFILCFLKWHFTFIAITPHPLLYFVMSWESPWNPWSALPLEKWADMMCSQPGWSSLMYAHFNTSGNCYSPLNKLSTGENEDFISNILFSEMDADVKNKCSTSWMNSRPLLMEKHYQTVLCEADPPKFVYNIIWISTISQLRLTKSLYNKNKS